MAQSDETTDVVYFTPEQLTKRFGVSIITVMSWIDSGELKAIKASRDRNSKKPRYRISPRALEQFENARSTMPNQPKPVSRRRPLPRVKEYV